MAFPLYLDFKQTLYRQLGLGRRCLVLRSHKVGEFGRKKLLGVKIPPVYPGDDILLMGGDYIIRRDGKLIYGYPTEENERPSIPELLNAIKQQ